MLVMPLSKCLSPLRVRLPDKTIRYVPCGKCEACRSLKSYQWKKRLDSEMNCNRFTMAITLTYDENNLPYIMVHPDRTITYHFFEAKREFELPLNVYNDLDKVYNFHKYKRFRNGDYKIPVVSHTDLQEFIKRLKAYAPTIRWFIQSEVGGTSFRPHYHGLLFFSEYDPDYIKEAIFKAWPKCDWSIPEHRDSLHLADSSGYCTSYVASVLELPLIHRFGRFSMFHYSSNRPPIGSLSYSSDDIAKYQRAETIDTPRYDIRKNAYEPIPYLRNMQDKLFGKLPNYSLLSPAARSFLLNSYRFFSTPYKKDDGSVEYVCKYSQYAERFSRYLEVCPEQFEFFSSAFTADSSMRRIFSVSRQYYKQCAASHKLFVDYAFEEHYYKLEMAKLRQQYLYEEDFCNRRNLSPRWLIYKDPEFVASFQDSFGLVPDWVEYTLNGYGFDDIDAFTQQAYFYTLTNNVDCKAYFNRIHKILHESHKSKANRSYLRTHHFDYLTDVNTAEPFEDNKQNLFCPF